MSLTRRRAFGLGAAAALGSLLTRATPPTWAARSTCARSASLAVAPVRFGGDGRTGVLRARRRFDLLGVKGADVRRAGLEVRVRARGGGWSPWVAVHHGGDHRPDTGTGEHASDPVWAGGAHELQLRARNVPRGKLKIHLVSVTRGARRRGARAVAAQRKAQSQPGGAPPIITRDQWGGASCAPRAAASYGEVQMAFVHHTVGANDYTAEESPAIVLAVCKYHRDTNGWNDVGYNFLVDRYGQIFEGRAGGIDAAVIGAQAQGYNRFSTGVAVLGTHTDVPATPECVEAIARLLAWKLPLHGAPVTGEVVVESGGGDANRYGYGQRVKFQRISGHRDGGRTACPGNQLYPQLPAIRERAAALAPAVAAAAVVAIDPPADPAVVYGEDLVLTGTARRGDGGPLAGEQVLVQKRGRRGWVTVARTTADGAGAWTVRFAWRAAGTVRARVRPSGQPVTVSRPLTVGLVPRLTGRTTVRRVRSGTTVTVDGAIRPATRVRVTIDREGKDGRYRRVGQTVVRPRRGRYRAVVRLNKPGLYRLTPRVLGSKDPVAAPALYVRAVRSGRTDVDPSGVGGTASS